MSSARELSERDRITIKIHNMKRSASRDSPPPRKRVGRYEDREPSRDSDERMSPDRVQRRRVVRSPSPRHHYEREEYVRPSREGPVYKVLCVSALHPKASDEFIKETLYREYKKFGDFNIKISHDLDERVAYVCFRTADDAREAKLAKPRTILYDKVALVEPVYESTKQPEYRVRRSMSPGEYERHYYTRSPGPERGRRPPPAEHHPYDRYGPPHAMAPTMHHPPEFRPVMHGQEHYMHPRGPPIHHGHHSGPHMHPGAAPHHHYIPRPYAPRAPRLV